MWFFSSDEDFYWQFRQTYSNDGRLSFVGTKTKTRKAVRHRKPPPTPCCSPGGITTFGCGFPEWKKMVKNPKTRTHDSFRITPKIESLVVFAILDIPWKFQKDFSITFWVILLTQRQTNSGKNITSLAKVIKLYIKTIYIIAILTTDKRW